MKTMKFTHALATMLLTAVSCEILDNNPDLTLEEADSTYVTLEEVAEILADLPLQKVQMDEVYDAVSSSSDNGYDEEYTMRHLFGNPGAGVGDKEVRSDRYASPLWKMIEDNVRARAAVKSPGTWDPDDFLKELTESDVQIYWPYSENWDGKDLPIITFDPEDGAKTNIGYRIISENDGNRRVEKIIVDEATAAEKPVWVVNRNSDAGYTSLEMLRREDPQWGEGGGTIIVHPKGTVGFQSKSKDSMRTLILKDFTMNRNYDSWFAGASEFFVLTITGGCSFVQKPTHRYL